MQNYAFRYVKYQILCNRKKMGKPKCLPVGRWLNKYSASIP